MVPFYNAQLDDIKLNLKIMLSKIAQPHAQLANNEEMILNQECDWGFGILVHTKQAIKYEEHKLNPVEQVLFFRKHCGQKSSLINPSNREQTNKSLNLLTGLLGEARDLSVVNTY